MSGRLLPWWLHLAQLSGGIVGHRELVDVVAILLDLRPPQKSARKMGEKRARGRL